MSIYLRAASPDGSIITGRVLHLAVWAPDAPGTTLIHGGTWVALCSRPYARPVHYRATGPGYRGWHRHAHWPLCSHCSRHLAALGTAMLAQYERVALQRRCPDWRDGARCGLVLEHEGAHIAVTGPRTLTKWGPPHLNPPAATTRKRATS